MEYACERIEGWKRNTKLFKINSHLYYQNLKHGNKVYLRCMLKKKLDCRGSAILTISSNSARLKTHHNHGPDAYELDRLEAINLLKRKAECSKEKLREVYENATKEIPILSSVSFRQIENTLYKRRRLSDPPVPRLAAEFAEMLESIEIEQIGNYKGYATDGNHHAFIFFSDKMANLSHCIRHIQIDTTYSKIPGIFTHLWTIFIIAKNIGNEEKQFPAFHVLLNARSQSLYIETVKKLKEVLPQLSPVSALCDYSLSLRNSLNAVFPNIILQGCFYQYCRSIWQTVKEYKVHESCQYSFQIALWVKLLMCVPLLPANQVSSQITELCADCPESSEEHIDRWKKLKNQVSKQWLHQIDAEDLSLFAGETNLMVDPDLYIRQLYTKTHGPVPNLWSFISMLNKIIVSTDAEFDGYENLVKPKWKKPNLHVIESETLEQLKESLLTEAISTGEYYSEVTKLVEPYLSQFMETKEFPLHYLEKIPESDDIQVVIQFQDPEIVTETLQTILTTL